MTSTHGLPPVAQLPDEDPAGRRILYHYTDAGALQGILSNAEIWATSARFLNDSSEIHGAFARAAHLLDKHPASLEDSGIREGFDRFRSYVTQSARISPNVAIASLSEVGDLLSQWRAYGGYSVGFDAVALRERLDPRFQLVQCQYKQAQHDALLNWAIMVAVDAAQAEPNREDKALGERVFDKLYSRVLFVSSAIKHRAFAEEREWRIVSRRPLDGRSLHVRQRGRFLVQYAKIKLPVPSDETNSLVLDLVVGPSPHQRMAMDGVNALDCLVPRGMRPLQMQCSRTPYISQ